MQKWGKPAEAPVSNGEKIYRGSGGWVYYLSPNQTDTFTMGAETDISALAQVKGAAPLLRREMSKLLSTSDQDRHVSLLFAPNYLFSDGRKLFTQSQEKILYPLSWFLGDYVQGALISAHFDQYLHLEMRFQGELIVLE